MMIMGNLRNLSVLGLLALAGATSGCIIESNHCSGSSVDTDWTILDTSRTMTLTCAQAGAAFVDLYVDGARVDEVPCTDMTIASAVPSGDHNIQYKLIDSIGAVISSVPALPVNVCGSTPLPSIEFDVPCLDGAVQATWQLTSRATSSSVTCLPGDTVTITVDSMHADFACSAYGGTTPAISGGVNHNVSLTLSDSGGATVSQTQTMGLFVHCGTTENIGQVPFETP